MKSTVTSCILLLSATFPALAADGAVVNCAIVRECQVGQSCAMVNQQVKFVGVESRDGDGVELYTVSNEGRLEFVANAKERTGPFFAEDRSKTKVYSFFGERRFAITTLPGRHSTDSIFVQEGQCE